MKQRDKNLRPETKYSPRSMSVSKLKQANALSSKEQREIVDVKMELQLTHGKVEKITMDLERAYEKIAILMVMEEGAWKNVKIDSGRQKLTNINIGQRSWIKGRAAG